jgi:hypothetical protein
VLPEPPVYAGRVEAMPTGEVAHRLTCLKVAQADTAFLIGVTVIEQLGWERSEFSVAEPRISRQLLVGGALV